MELFGDLKNKVNKPENKTEAKKIIYGAGMPLTTDELDQVSGGYSPLEGYAYCPGCGYTCEAKYQSRRCPSCRKENLKAKGGLE